MDIEQSRDRVIMLVGIVLLSFLLLLLDSIGTLGMLYNVAAYVSSPLKKEVRSVVIGVNDFFGTIGRIGEFKDENEYLKKENKKLTEKISNLQECRVQLEALDSQTKIKKKDRSWILESQVINIDTSVENSLQINRGSEDGVTKGDIVVFGKFAIGEVIKVNKYVSKVLLITSPSSNIPVRGQKNRALGLVKGEVGQTLKMIDILIDEKIEEGELVITSGKESHFPAGYIVGVVSEVNDNPSFATQEALITTQIDFQRLDYVYVIRGQNK